MSTIQRDLGQIFEKLERTEENIGELKGMIKDILLAQNDQVSKSVIRDQKLDNLQEDMDRVKPFVDKLSSGYVFLLGFIFAFTSIGTVIGVLFSSNFQKAAKAISTYFGGG